MANPPTPPWSCAECDSTNVETHVVTDKMKYGVAGPNQVVIVVDIPVRRCKRCGFEYTDWEAEDIRTAAINRYLEVKRNAG